MSCSSGTQLQSWFSLPCPWAMQKDRELGLQSGCHTAPVFSAAPSSSHSYLFQHGFPPKGDSPPWNSSLRIPPTGCISSWTAPMWLSSTECSPSGTRCSRVRLPQGHKSCQQTCSSMGSSLHGSAGPSRSLFQHGISTESQPLSDASTCSGLGTSTGCRWIFAPL